MDPLSPIGTSGGSDPKNESGCRREPSYQVRDVKYGIAEIGSANKRQPISGESPRCSAINRERRMRAGLVGIACEGAAES